MIALYQIKGAIYTSIIQDVRGNSNRNTEDWNIHASEIALFCPRRYMLCKKYNIPFHKKDTGMPLGLAVTFQIGLAMEEFFIKSMEKNGNITTLFSYKCPNCRVRYAKSSNEPKVCPKCKSKLIKEQFHLQYPVLDDVYINGHPDLIMKVDSMGDKFNVFELKSINPIDFDNLTRPFINHEYQIKTYLWLLAHLRLHQLRQYNIDTKIGYLVYVKKTYGRDPIKIFKVELDNEFDTEIKSIILQLRGKEKIRKICNSENSLVARQCPVVKQCWR